MHTQSCGKSSCSFRARSSLQLLTSRLMASDGGAVNRESPAKIASAPVAAFLKLSDAADISNAEVEAARVAGAPAIRAPLKALVGAKASAEGLSAEIATAITASFMMGRGVEGKSDHYCEVVVAARDRNGLGQEQCMMRYVLNLRGAFLKRRAEKSESGGGVNGEQGTAGAT